MNPKAIRFAVVRFMPYVQTREFANIGIIAICPATRWLGFKIEARYRRLSHFFQYFNAKVYKNAIQHFQAELQRVQTTLHNGSAEQLRAAFDQLARPREAIIQTGNIGVTLAADEQQELLRLFDYYVGHSFAQEPQEQKLTKSVTEWVRGLNLAYPFTEQKVGNDEYHVRLPLVQRTDGEVRKIIKPIYLGHDNAPDIYQKADQWQAKFNRLRDFKLITPHTGILLPYIPPHNPSAAQTKAFQSVLDDFQRQGILVAPSGDRQAITRFSC